LTGTFDWRVVLDGGIGIMCLLIGIGILIVCSALAAFFKRLNGTLDGLDAQVAALSAPIAATLGHVDGIADTADLTIARLGAVVGSLESVAAGVSKTSTLATNAVAPTIVNLGATLTGISAGLRRFVTGKNAHATTGEEHLERPIEPATL